MINFEIRELFPQKSINMKVDIIKTTLLEHLVRNLLHNCGFSSVYSTNPFPFNQNRFCFTYGKNAFLDSGFKINPQIKIPFTYPIQLFFEFKSSEIHDSLAQIQNASEFRDDLNQMEFVGSEHYSKQQNFKRSLLQIESETAYTNQVGAALIKDFDESAVAFASHHKIPLLSLSWFLESKAIKKINALDQTYIDSISKSELYNLYDFLKDNQGNLNDVKYCRAKTFLNSDRNLGSIISRSNETIQHTYTGILETGELVFLKSRSRSEETVLNQQNPFVTLKGELHGCSSKPNQWRLSVYNQRELENQTDFDFYVPQHVFSIWKSENLEQSTPKASSLKVYVFNKKHNPELPFSVVTIDRAWLDKVVYY